MQGGGCAVSLDPRDQEAVRQAVAEEVRAALHQELAAWPTWPGPGQPPAQAPPAATETLHQAAHVLAQAQVDASRALEMSVHRLTEVMDELRAVVDDIRATLRKTEPEKRRGGG